MVVSSEEFSAERSSHVSEGPLRQLDSLPAELRRQIVFNYLSFKDIVSLSRTSKRWNSFVWCELPELHLTNSGFNPEQTILRICSTDNLSFSFLAHPQERQPSRYAAANAGDNRLAPAVDQFVSSVVARCVGLRVLDVRSHRHSPLIGVGRYSPVLYANESTVLNVSLLRGLDGLETLMCDFLVHPAGAGREVRFLETREKDEQDMVLRGPPSDVCGLPSVRRVHAVAHLGDRYKLVENGKPCHGLYGGRRTFKGFKPGRGAAWFLASFPQLETLQLAYPRVQWADNSPLAGRLSPIEFRHQRFATFNVAPAAFFDAVAAAKSTNVSSRLVSVVFEDCAAEPDGYVTRPFAAAENGTWTALKTDDCS